MLKRLFSALLIVELLWCALPTVRAEGTVKISAAAAVLMDAGTGRVLWAVSYTHLTLPTT